MKTLSMNPRSFGCPKCKGELSSYSAVSTKTKNSFIERVITLLDRQMGTHRINCPECTKPMLEVHPFKTYRDHEAYGVLKKADAEGKVFAPELCIDVCTDCYTFWFDHLEVGKIPKIKEYYDQNSEMTNELHQNAVELSSFPIVEGMKPVYSSSTATFTIIVISIVLFLISQKHPELTNLLGLHENNPTLHYGMNWLTSIFMHGNFFHLASNCYFLYIFGRYVEDELGTEKFWILFFVSALGGSLTQLFADHAREAISIGASGGIAGLMIYFSVRFPRANISLIKRFRDPWRPYDFIGTLVKMEIPAPLFCVLWITLQVVFAFAIPNSETAYWCHIGGGAMGLLFYLLNWNQD